LTRPQYLESSVQLDSREESARTFDSSEIGENIV
jgi:hypothetical protein